MSGSQKKDQREDKHSSEAPSNFCPTSHGVIKEGIRSVQHGNRSAKSEKADLTSAFLIASDQRNKVWQPVMMRPPKEWLEDYDEWYCYCLQCKEKV